MTQRSLAVLITLNAVLLAAIALTFTPPSKQVQAAQFGGSSYVMLAGNTGQASEQVVYVMDPQEQQLGAFIFNSSTKKARVFTPRNIAKDLKKVKSGR